MEETRVVEPDGKPTAPAEKRRRAARTAGIVVAIVVVIAAAAALAYGLATHPLLTAAIRDISIIVLALVTLVIGLALVVLIIQLQSLIALLRDEVRPILKSANQTASTVRGTTTFISDAVVAPMIAAASYVSAVRETVRVLTGRPGKKRRGAGTGHETRQGS